MSAQLGTDVAYAAELLAAGELVAIPTETVYGLAANAFLPEAVAQIFEVKGRPRFNPLIIHTDRLEKIADLVHELPPSVQALADRFLPGPLTFLLPRNERLPEIITAGSERVGIRIPQHPLCLKLLQQLAFPLAAPSANPSGYISPTSAQHVSQQLGKQIPYILDGGECQVGLESTIIGLEADQQLQVYRLGGLALEEIEAVVGRVRLAPSIAEGSNPASPGQLKSHYAPQTPLFLGEMSELLTEHGLKGSVLLSLEDLYPDVPTQQQFRLSPAGSLQEAAARLFALLRALDQAGFKRILAQPVPEEGLGRAINDRLRRAREDQK
ncbi:MAG: L-threonylcarbamoyladenylate synthase [Bacteroidota bacterium]